MALLNELPEGAQVLDLGAARVARAEASTTRSFLKLAAGYVEVKSEVPLQAAFSVADADIKGALASLLADPADFDALLADGLTSGDITAITEFIAGKSLGESQA